VQIACLQRKQDESEDREPGCIWDSFGLRAVEQRGVTNCHVLSRRPSDHARVRNLASLRSSHSSCALGFWAVAYDLSLAGAAEAQGLQDTPTARDWVLPLKLAHLHPT